MTFSTFERQLLVIQLLQMGLASYFDFDGFQETHLYVYFYAYMSAIILIFAVCPIYELPKGISDVFQRVPVLAID